MRGKKKEAPEIERKPVVDDSNKMMAVVTRSAQEAAQSARDTAEIAKAALENEDYGQLKKAITDMTDAVHKMSLAVENKFTPIRVIPKRDSRGVAISYDILQLKKKVH